MPALQSASALLPPGPPQQETQQIQDKHGGLGERAEEGFVVLLSLENVLWEESTGGSCNSLFWLTKMCCGLESPDFHTGFVFTGLCSQLKHVSPQFCLSVSRVYFLLLVKLNTV